MGRIEECRIELKAIVNGFLRDFSPQQSMIYIETDEEDTCATGLVSVFSCFTLGFVCFALLPRDIPRKKETGVKIAASLKPMVPRRGGGREEC